MNTHALGLFALTVIPLICVPGPDMLFIVSQAISGAAAGLRATAGVCAGYVIHSLLVRRGLPGLSGFAIAQVSDETASRRLA